MAPNETAEAMTMTGAQLAPPLLVVVLQEAQGVNLVANDEARAENGRTSKRKVLPRSLACLSSSTD